MSINKEYSNINILDSLRAFAALSVCLYHFIYTTTGYINSKWVLNIFLVGKYGVHMFFVVSGFVIPWSMYYAKYELKYFFNFFLKRLSRLEPPYIVSLAIALLILFLREKIGLKNDHIAVSFTQVFLHFGYLIPFFEKYKWLNQVYWTLAIEFQYYLFIALVFPLIIKSNLFIRFILYAVVFSQTFIGGASFLPYWLPVFFIGILLFLYKAGCIQRFECYLVTIVLLIFCFYKYEAISLLYIIVPIIAVLHFSKYKIPVLNYCGKISYSIYLIHPLIGASVINILSHSMNTLFLKIITMLFGVLITLISSYIMYIFIEKPSKELSASLKYN